MIVDDTRIPTRAGYPDVNTFEPADGRALVVIAAAGIGVDASVRSGVTSITGALLVALVAGGILGTGRVANRRAQPALVAAPLFGMWLAIRQAEWLIAFDVLAAGSLLVLGASWSRAGDPRDLTIPGLIGRAAYAITHAALAPGFVRSGFRRRRPRARGQANGVLRGVALATPVVIVVALLLRSADPVFASIVRLPGFATNASDLVAHSILLVVGAWGAAGLLRLASAEPFDAETGAEATTRENQRNRVGQLGTTEATTVLSGLVAVFALFAATQVAATLGGDDFVRRTAGVSYADYARNGFFQLLAVAVVTLAVLLAVRATVTLTHSDRRRFVVLAEVAVVLTLVVVAGAVRRLWLYEQAYGLTTLRLCSLLFALWIGATFVLLGLSMADTRSTRSWFVPASIAAALTGLLVLNAANPEAIIVRRNVDRFAGTDTLDIPHLLALSDDAVPELVSALPRLSPEQAEVVKAAVCAGERRSADGPLAYNGARAAAIEARNSIC